MSHIRLTRINFKFILRLRLLSLTFASVCARESFITYGAFLLHICTTYENELVEYKVVERAFGCPVHPIFFFV